MSEERTKALDIDWRYRAASTLAEDWSSPFSGVLHKAGTPVVAQTFFKHGEKRIQVGDPSAPALFLSYSNKMYEQARNNHPFTLEQSSGWEVNDYLETVMASIVFAYTALESFANEEIPEDFTYETKKPSSEVLVVYEKENIERYVSLDEKLATVLPQAMKLESPKGSKVWEDYVILRRFRDRIIHMKEADRARSNANDLYPDSIWSEVLRPEQPNFPLTAKNMMLHFRGKNPPHWLKNCPF